LLSFKKPKIGKRTILNGFREKSAYLFLTSQLIVTTLNRAQKNNIILKMKKYLVNICSYFILSILFTVTSCNGQAKGELPENDSIQQASIKDGQPKIVRTQGATSGNIGCELQDRDGNLWFTAGGEGVYRFDGKAFTNFTTKDGLSDNNASVIIQDKSGNILVGTNAGICKYNGKTFSNYFESDTLNKPAITSLLEDRDGNIWFGTMNNGVYRYDGKMLTNFLNNDDHPFNLGVHNQLILDILQDKNGNLWFCSFNGGGVWQYNGDTFKNFLPSPDYYLSNEDGRNVSSSKPGSLPIFSYPPTGYISDDMITSVSEDKAGNLWFATRRHGACRYDGKTFTSFREGEGFVSYGITTILEDKKGIIWFGTDKDGVFSYDGKTFKKFTTADGLINDSVRSILEDKDGNLWFGTRWFGLSRFDGKNFITFSEYKEE
jgi:ligand-binding sensor domain-containing protein